MKKVLMSIKKRPVNLILIVIVIFLYLFNNTYLKGNTEGVLRKFFISYFNDFICPLLFISYSNLLLLTVNRELRKFHWIMLFGLCSGLIWEFFAPLVKSSSVTDVFDLVSYLSGSFLYWCIIKLVCSKRERESYDNPQKHR